jgi:hypothetical protein
MLQEIKIRYFNESLEIAMVSWREVYILKPHIKRLNIEVDKGRLIYRAKGSGKRISYKRLKKGLIKKSFSVFEEVPDWLQVFPQTSLKNKTFIKHKPDKDSCPRLD